ncbi:MAG: DUF4194 domain-containing protein [Planctomycetota bacterium]
MTTSNALPEWMPAAVALLRGTVYGTDERLWALVLGNRSSLESYVSRIGLRLVVDEMTPGIAYLRQAREDELPDGVDGVPQLIRQTRLSYAQTVLTVLLRDEYRRFEDGNTPDERCVFDEADLFDQWCTFFGADEDEKKLRTSLKSCLSRLSEIGFVRKLKSAGSNWEVLPILKARLTIEVLEDLRDQLARHPGGRAADDDATDADGVLDV